jgi:tRNA U34 5-methylaminomethyl-2-thiouridine-forming methyltransferase MnmC
MYVPPDDLRPRTTRDGSLTLRSEVLDEQYHSLHGALNESLHVFIRNGLEQVHAERVDILEVGLGTGLNALLTWCHADRAQRAVRYTALEPHPLPAASLAALDHARTVGAPERAADFLRMMAAPPGTVQAMSPWFQFMWMQRPLAHLEIPEDFDLIYHDAFSPSVQPELWTEAAFRHVHALLRPGGALVTYCAKGAVRRAMLAAGLEVQRLQGPPGKREMLRAVRPSPP